MIDVDWDDAQAYCRWLAAVTGKPYRLPSEAEWEYCCRAGTTTAYSTGDTVTQEQAQFEASQTREVGVFPANAWGFHDMHGNVWEWCEDAWHDSYDGASDDGSPWLGGGDSSLRILRGGSWFINSQGLRSADRNWNRPDLRVNYIGFRLARTLLRRSRQHQGSAGRAQGGMYGVGRAGSDPGRCRMRVQGRS